MAKAPLQNITIVATFLSPGVTVGGFGIRDRRRQDRKDRATGSGVQAAR